MESDAPAEAAPTLSRLTEESPPCTVNVTLRSTYEDDSDDAALVQYGRDPSGSSFHPCMPPRTLAALPGMLGDPLLEGGAALRPPPSIPAPDAPSPARRWATVACLAAAVKAAAGTLGVLIWRDDPALWLMVPPHALSIIACGLITSIWLLHPELRSTHTTHLIFLSLAQIWFSSAWIAFAFTQAPICPRAYHSGRASRSPVVGRRMHRDSRPRRCASGVRSLRPAGSPRGYGPRRSPSTGYCCCSTSAPPRAHATGIASCDHAPPPCGYFFTCRLPSQALTSRAPHVAARCSTLPPCTCRAHDARARRRRAVLPASVRLLHRSLAPRIAPGSAPPRGPPSRMGRVSRTLSFSARTNATAS